VIVNALRVPEETIVELEMSLFPDLASAAEALTGRTSRRDLRSSVGRTLSLREVNLSTRAIVLAGAWASR
jgi:hypothetical protein